MAGDPPAAPPFLANSKLLEVRLRPVRAQPPSHESAKLLPRRARGQSLLLGLRARKIEKTTPAGHILSTAVRAFAPTATGNACRCGHSVPSVMRAVAGPNWPFGSPSSAGYQSIFRPEQRN